MLSRGLSQLNEQEDVAKVKFQTPSKCGRLTWVNHCVVSQVRKMVLFIFCVCFFFGGGGGGAFHSVKSIICRVVLGSKERIRVKSSAIF